MNEGQGRALEYGSPQDHGSDHFLHPEPCHLDTELTCAFVPENPSGTQRSHLLQGGAYAWGLKGKKPPEDTQLRSKITYSK